MQLKNPPIKEALIDFRVVLPEDFAVETLKEICDRIANGFPDVAKIRRGEFGFSVNSDKAEAKTLDTSHIGYRCTSADGLEVAQVRVDGFTFSRLAPYNSWNELLSRASEVWNIYCKVAIPKLVIRVATRYINSLQIPIPFDDFNQFLTCPPQVPDGLPQGLNSFLSRWVSYDTNIDAKCIFTQAFEGIVDNTAIILLDIDTFVSGDYEVSEGSYFDKLEQLHEFKNKVFFASITDKALEEFNK